ncbi:hypothetical protein ACFL54_06000 [Planctomycetota bacterium]
MTESDKPKRKLGVVFWVTLTLIILLVYILSSAPVLLLCYSQWADDSTIMNSLEIFYYPIHELYQNGNSLCHWYFDLWDGILHGH